MSIEEKYLKLFDGTDDSFILRLELLSPLILPPLTIDINDIQSCVLYDMAGSLFISGSTIRGALKCAALEIVKRLEDSKSYCTSIDDIGTLFGTSNSSGLLRVTDCHLKNHFQNFAEITQMNYCCSIDRFTMAANNNSFYKMELLKEKTVFFGKIKFRNKIEYKLLILLIRAIKNLRRIGRKSHMGYGLIKCDLIDERGMIISERYIDNLKCESLIP